MSGADPTAGVPAEIERIARQHERYVDAIAQGASFIASAIGDADGWQGAAQQRFVAVASEMPSTVRRIVGRLEETASVLRSYAREVEQIQDEAARNLAARKEARASVAANDRASTTIRDRLAGGDAVEADEVQLRRLHAESASLASTQARLASQWEELVERRAAADRRTARGLESREVIGRLLTAKLLAQMTSDELLAYLAGLNREDLAALARDERIAALLSDVDDPERVAEWWNGLDEGAQWALVSALPGVIGNLEGVAYWARDAANRRALADRIKRAEAEIDRLTSSDAPYDVGGAAFAAAFDELATLLGMQRTLDAKNRRGRRYLIALTSDTPPLAAMAIGDLDTASNVTWAVPGMGSSTKSFEDWASAAQRVYNEQGAVKGPSDRAVIAWLGYKAPPVPGVGAFDLGVWDTEYASEGGNRLAASIRGLTAVRSGSVPATHVLAHSYGTTTAALGLTHSDVHVDSLVCVGSAGLPDDVESIEDLHADRVFAGQAQNVLPRLEKGAGDQWAWIGRELSGNHGIDPIDRDFGATSFSVAGTDERRGVTDHAVHTEGNTGYLDSYTESLRNVALATTGQGDLVTPYQEPRLTLLQQGLLSTFSPASYQVHDAR